MAHQPVQVVINVERLRAPRDVNTPNGNGKDFFAGRNSAFAAHRSHIATALRAIREALAADKAFGGLGYVKVTMAHNAIAKSHRPHSALFRSRWTPHVATDGIGEPIFAVTPQALDKVIAAVEAAETVVGTKVIKATGEVVPNPSRKRCEVSAIDSVALWTEQDKRDFSAAEAASWLSKSGTGGGYIVERFPSATAPDVPSLASAEAAALAALRVLVRSDPVQARALNSSEKGQPRRVSVKVVEKKALTQADSSENLPVTADSDEHQLVLAALARNPLVRSISLPPVVNRELAGGFALGQPVSESDLERPDDKGYARVGVIDGGVGDSLTPWVAERWGQLAPSDRDTNHGTFISGLLVAAGRLNPYLSGQTHGCFVYDIDVLPDDPGGTGMAFDAYYPGGVPEFLDEIEEAVGEYRREHAVRVFNLSMNFTTPHTSDTYGFTATRLDEIARLHDVIFVISAGNLAPIDNRPEWDKDADNALTALAADSVGFLTEPGESLLNVSVSALNPPDMDGQVPMALARYSRRGPGLRGATKPDFAHVGGSGTLDADGSTGLFSVDESGLLVSSAGTSFAAPLVARRLADLDALIEGDVSREVLLATLVHFSEVPDVFTQKAVKPLARDLIGFGVPNTAEEMLERDESEITLVFDSVVKQREEASLIFSWPEALVSAAGKCRGYARLTLVARPYIAYAHGDERVRVNIGARLMQQQKDGGFANKLKAVNTDAHVAGAPASERDLLVESMKWQVVKCFEGRFAGVGASSTWKLLIDYLERADEALPVDGVEFAAVLTIADPQGEAPVFAQMRQNLSAQGIRTDDIRTSIRTRAAT